MIIYLPFKHYQYYGDKQMLAQAYGPMKAYLEWLGTKADKKDGIMRWSGASDWIEVGIEGWGPPKRTPTFVVSTCAWYLYATMLTQTARIVGTPAEVSKYEQLAKQIKEKFNAKCFDPSTGLYGGAADSQTSLILPLSLGIVPDDKRDLVTKKLVENIAKWKGHLNTGFVGTPYLMEGLAELGLADLSYQMVTQQDYPGWKTLINDGVMKETWRGGLAQMPSLGGSIGQWFYKVAAGIRPDPAGPGFKRFFIRPAIMGDLTWVKCSYDSIHGRIVSNWKREDSKLTMEITVPSNTTATVHVPAKDAAGVTESGKPASAAQGVKFLKQENGAAVYGVYPGSYSFQSTLP
jgi:alpha-L-rhamnosidase